jgi:excisionase family DNA binding protein
MTHEFMTTTLALVLHAPLLFGLLAIAEPPLLDVEEASELLHLRPATLREWVLKRRIPFVKLGRRVFFKRDQLLKLIESSVVSPVSSPEGNGARKP